MVVLAQNLGSADQQQTMADRPGRWIRGFHAVYRDFLGIDPVSFRLGRVVRSSLEKTKTRVMLDSERAF